MSEPIRVLYELLTGNALRSESHRVRWEIVRSRFQCPSGLTLTDSSLWPSVMAGAHGNPNGAFDVLKLESTLWLVLKLYAMITSNTAADARLSKIEFPAALLPTAVFSNPLKHRSTFQLHQVITIL